MAVTKMWKYESRLDILVNYVKNGEKTENCWLVSGINCSNDITVNEMRNVKKQFFKTDGIECFHGIQSFEEGEVTPEVAHLIGIKLARELWGDKFQVLVATHVNTDNVHNHFVLNSVSFIDGKRFSNTKKDYAMMRKASDKLCEDYGLSVLSQDEKYDKYATSSLYKELMRDCIDYAIKSAKNYEQFIKILEDLGYIVTERNNTLSIRREPYKRNTRIERQFGKQYTIENIYKRILETPGLDFYFPDQRFLYNKSYNQYKEVKKNSNYKKGSILGLIYEYEKLLGINPENSLKSNMATMTPELIREIKQMDEYSKQGIFLTKNNIETEEQLAEFEKATREKVNPLKSERENLWKKHKRAKTEEKKSEIEEEIREISKTIAPLAEDIRLCGDISARMAKIRAIELRQKMSKEMAEVKKEVVERMQNTRDGGYNYKSYNKNKGRER